MEPTSLPTFSQVLASNLAAGASDQPIGEPSDALQSRLRRPDPLGSPHPMGPRPLPRPRIRPTGSVGRPPERPTRTTAMGVNVGGANGESTQPAFRYHVCESENMVNLAVSLQLTLLSVKHAEREKRMSMLVPNNY